MKLLKLKMLSCISSCDMCNFHIIVVCSLPAHMLQTGVVFGGICLRVSAFVCWKSRKLLVGNQCNLVGICSMGNTRNGWKLVTFDLDLGLNLWPSVLLLYFLNSGYIFWVAWPSNFIFSLEMQLQTIWSRFSFKVMGSRSRSQQQKSNNSKTTGRKLLGLDQNMC